MSLATSALAYSANYMRSAMIKSSQANETGANISGKSVGFKGDGIKLGGTRALEGKLAFTGSPGALGGFQGGQGTIFGSNYAVGSWKDYLVEAYAGPHDFVNSFMYNDNGNLSTSWQSGLQGATGDVISYANVLPATPFVIASVVPQSATAHLYGDL